MEICSRRNRTYLDLLGWRTRRETNLTFYEKSNKREIFSPLIVHFGRLDNDREDYTGK